ncbi:MAG TPA: DUF58 domain-containing protein [Opitutales bacterium]|nr:DUF58 domain-containing protein [Opitutales bacterium]
MISQRDIFKKVRQVEIRTRRAVTDSLVGSYHSVFRGQGIDFEETREYMPGDDVRAINWNITARMDRPFVKVFREERELTVLLAVDLSASQSFGSVEKSKREVAAELAAILAFSALRNNDKAGLLLFTDEVESYIPPRKGSQHLLRVVREILFHEPKGKGTGRTKAFDFINHVLPRRAMVFFISDLSCETPPVPDSPQARLLSVTAARHDLVVADLFDRRDAELPDIGVVMLEDPESGRRVEVDTSDKRFLKRYAEAGASERRGWEKLVRQSGAGYMAVPSDADVVRALSAYMQRRALAR